MRKCFREQKKRKHQQEQSHKARLPEAELLMPRYKAEPYDFSKIVEQMQVIAEGPKPKLGRRI